MNTKEKNAYLIESVSQLRLLNAELVHLKYENEELRKMLSFKESSPLSLLGGTVVNSQLSGFIHTLTLNSGKNVGLEENMPIIDMHGLLGKTISIGDRASSVQLITDKNFRVSVKTGENWNLGIFIPTHGKFGNIDIVKILLKYKANKNIETDTKLTPLMAAARGGYDDIVNIFLSQIARMGAPL